MTQQSAQLKDTDSARWVHPTGGFPKSVHLVACGPTQASYHISHQVYTPAIPRSDETWTLNKAPRTVRCDLGFVMDDIVGECRKSAVFSEDLGRFVGDWGIPVITSTVDREVRDHLPPDCSVTAYPINRVLTHVGVRILSARGYPPGKILDMPDVVHRIGRGAGYYLHNSIPFILAYALFIGVEQINIFGADYTYPGMAAREDDRANTEYWVAALRFSGVVVNVTTDTTLLNQRDQPYLYGYGARPPVIDEPEVRHVVNELATLGLFKSTAVRT